MPRIPEESYPGNKPTKAAPAPKTTTKTPGKVKKTPVKK